MRVLVLILCLPLFALGQISNNVNLLDHWDCEWVNPNNAGYQYNEVWGFVHDNQEYAVIGSVIGTHIFRITGDNKLDSVGYIPGGFQGNVTHRDFHDYKGYLYGVCDQGDSLSSLQIMDLQYLPDSVSLVQHSIAGIQTVHNVFIDTSNGAMFLCSPAFASLEVWDLADPVNPTYAYAHPFFNVVHDVYARNDTAFLNCAHEGLWVYKFDDLANPTYLGSLEFYPDKGYNHSGWLNKAGDVYVMCDETEGMKIKALDVSDLTDIKTISLFGTEWWDNTAPHNIMIKDNIAYVSYYNDGLQVFDLREPASPKQIAFYDTELAANDKNWKGAWGIYSFLPSGRILISDRTHGLFLFDVPLIANDNHDIGVYPNPGSDAVYFYKENRLNQPIRIFITTSDGKLVDVIEDSYSVTKIEVTNYASGLYTYVYVNDATNEQHTGKFVVE